MCKNMAVGSSEVALGETLLHLSAQKHVVLSIKVSVVCGGKYWVWCIHYHKANKAIMGTLLDIISHLAC